MKVYPKLIEDLIENGQKVGRQFFNKEGKLCYEEPSILDKIQIFL